MTYTERNQMRIARKQDPPSAATVMAQPLFLLTEERTGDPLEFYRQLLKLEQIQGTLPVDALWCGARALQKHFAFTE